MILALTSESSVEPVTLKEMKFFLRLDESESTAEDPYLNSLISGARKEAENKTKRSLVTASRKLIFDDFENSTQTLLLPRPPLSTSSSNVTITYTKSDTAGSSTTVNATSITIDSDSEPGRIFPAFNNTWPTDIQDQQNSVTIAYVTGYTTSNPVPEPIKTWIKMRAGEFYESREPFEVGAIISNHNRSHVDGLLDGYKVLLITS